MRLVLRLDSESFSVRLGHVALLPESVEQSQAHVAPKRLLDDLTIAQAGPRGTQLHSSHYGLVKRDGGANLGHTGILASRCSDAGGRAATRRVPEPKRNAEYSVEYCWPATETELYEPVN